MARFAADASTTGDEFAIVAPALTDAAGKERDVFEPGETAIFTVSLKALSDISNAHACMYIRTRDGQPLFDTATSRYSDARLTLSPGECATATFCVTLHLQNGIFPVGFSVSSEFDEYFVYCNMGLKQVVMTGDQKSNGFVHLNPKAELFMGKVEEEGLLQSEIAAG